jgi:hypothetical protein
MSDVSKRFEQLIKSAYKKLADRGVHLPRRSEQGILIGHVLIRSHGALKDIVVNGKTVYDEISLNCVAIRIANLLASNGDTKLCQQLIGIDREYSKHFMDSKFHIEHYHRANAASDSEKAEILWTKYELAKQKAMEAKSQAEKLSGF